VWLRRFGVLPQSAEERGKQARFLQARGFSSETIRNVLRGLPGED
jgi:regulatory protein